MGRMDALSEVAERRLVELLQSFGVVPSGAMKKALMDWKAEGWKDVLEWRLRS